jgi:type VI protein secretion system component VasK
MSGLAEIIVTVLIAASIMFYMYIQNLQDTKKDLEKQVKQKQSQIVQEKTKSNIKAFEARQKAKKEVLKSQKKDKNENKTDASVGPHTLYF